MIHIAVIDTFIDTSCQEFHCVPIRTVNYKLQTEFSDAKHGTAVCSLILKACGNVNVDILLLPIFDGLTGTCAVEDLIETLNYISLNEKIDIINISSGITQAEPGLIKELKKVCDRLALAGTIIVSAFDNDGCMTYPAAFDSVIGVDISREVPKISSFEFIENSPVNIRGSIKPQRVLIGNNQHVLAIGSSFIVPLITGQIAKILGNGKKNKNEILDILKHLAVSKKTFKVCDNIDFPKLSSKKAIAFPFNKEIHSLVCFSDLLTVDLVDVFDIKHTLRINRLASEILNRNIDCDYLIKNITSLDWSMDFDIIILGHIEEIVNYMGDDVVRLIVENSEKYKKTIYSFDDMIYQYIDKPCFNSKVFVPKINDRLCPLQNLGKMWKINTPVLSVLGTRSKQGKFTIQQEIRREMKRLKYNTGFLSTEPSGYLFGADMVFPCGYHSTVELSLNQQIIMLNEMLHNIDKKDIDLIITGGQSGTIPYNLYNIKNILIEQVAYLYGINPDGVILCICADDEIDYIIRTISFIESACNTNVIACFLFPISYKAYSIGQYHSYRLQESEEYRDIASSISTQIKKRVYIHCPEDIKQCVEEIVKYFSE